MSYTSRPSSERPWWREPTKDNWYAFIASWLGWTLDAFDFTVFLFLLVPIAKEFNADLTLVVLVGSLTMWMRFVGAVAAGWMADRMGRRAPLMISILWYSACNFIAGFSPTFLFLLVFRTLLGIGMGAEWPAGAALATESWPAAVARPDVGRAAGIVGAGLSGRRGAVCHRVRRHRLARHAMDGRAAGAGRGLDPRLRQGTGGLGRKPEAAKSEQRRKSKCPLAAIFRKGVLTEYRHLLLVAHERVHRVLLDLRPVRDLHDTRTASDARRRSAGRWHSPTGLTFIASFVWGSLTDSLGRRWAMIIPAIIGAAIAPIYLLTTDYTTILWAFSLQGAFAGAIYGINPSYANERFPTEVRATAAAFCYHMGAVVGGFVPPVLTYFAVERQMGFAIPMLIGTVGGLISFVVTLFFSPETKGKDHGGGPEIIRLAEIP